MLSLLSVGLRSPAARLVYRRHRSPIFHRARWASGYLVGGIIGTIAGFIIGNVFVTATGLLPLWAAHPLPRGVVEDPDSSRSLLCWWDRSSVPPSVRA